MELIGLCQDDSGITPIEELKTDLPVMGGDIIANYLSAALQGNSNP